MRSETKESDDKDIVLLLVCGMCVLERLYSPKLGVVVTLQGVRSMIVEGEEYFIFCLVATIYVYTVYNHYDKSSCGASLRLRI